MENAVKALIIAAGVLIGLMILSLGLSLYTSLNEFVGSSQEKIKLQEVQQFNEQFTKYINCDNTGTKIDFILTIQDVVTAANAAYENNVNQGDKIIVYLGTDRLDEEINSKSAEILQEGIDKKYKCKPQDVKINTITGKVESVTFEEY